MLLLWHRYARACPVRRRERTVGQMNGVSRISWFFIAWVGVVVLVGGILTSYHQPFVMPDANALKLVLAKGAEGGVRSGAHWQTTHLLSGGCGCSRRIMQHLLQRRVMPGVFEQVALVDDDEANLPGTAEVLDSLKASGFGVSHVASRDIAATSGVQGVPLLLVASPEGKVVYLGGYGPGLDQDAEILRRVRGGSAVAPLPVIGCAIGMRVKRSSDPFRLKY